VLPAAPALDLIACKATRRDTGNGSEDFAIATAELITHQAPTAAPIRYDESVGVLHRLGARHLLVMAFLPRRPDRLLQFLDAHHGGS